MYFSADLSIDPAAATTFKRVAPSKAFGKLFYYLTAGATGEKREIETFTAVSMLQSLNVAMRSIGINNIVRLARDATDYYLDTQGRKEDLQEAMAAYEARAKQEGAQQFELLQLVLEHEGADMMYLLDLRVRRQHRPGEFPLTVRINGALKGFGVDPTTGTAVQIKDKLSAVFENQAAYEAFVAGKKRTFDTFVASVQRSIEVNLATNQVQAGTAQRVLRPKSRKHRVDEIEHDYEDDSVEPIHAGYPGFDNVFFYAWVWSEMCHEHAIHVHDCTIVDGSGHALCDIGAEGFDAAATGTLNPDATFEAPVCEDVTYYGGHEYESELADVSLLPDSSGGGYDDGSSTWLDSSGSSDNSSDSSTSSCSSGGSSCGSSCGGCGGGGD